LTGRPATERWIAAVLVLAAPIGGAASLDAQGSGSRRVAIDTVVGVQDIFDSARDWPTVGILDTYSSVEIARGLQASVRPKFWRLNGDWDLVLDQASLQYSFHRGSNWRIEAGRFPSPIGLGMTENRSNVNGSVLWWHRPYYQPLPSLGKDAPRVALISAIYPHGALLTTSGDTWDARVALVDEAPVRFWQGDAGTDRHPNVIVGAGLTPRQGLRGGIAASVGDLTRGPAGRYRMLNVEGEYAFGYTRLTGEWTRDRFEMPGGVYTARGWTLQAQQTLTPRLYAHARTTTISSPDLSTSVARERRFRSLDATVGYYVDSEVTLKVSYSAVSNGPVPVDHQGGVAVTWARRWW
jgi:hypothetical protein